MAAVVEQGIHRLLQHPLFIVDDDVGRLQLHQVPQAVIAVDDAAVEVVQVGRRETPALEGHQGTQVRRNHRQHLQHHPLRTALGLDEALDHLQPLGELLLDLLGLGRTHLLLQLGDGGLHIGLDQSIAHRLRAHLGHERIITVLVQRLPVFVVGE